MNVAELIRNARVSSELNSKDVASLAGVSASTVTRIERGEMKPTVEMVQRLMEAAGYLLDFTVTAKSDPSAIAAARSVLCGDKTLALFGDAARYIEKWTRMGLLDAEGDAVSVREVAYRAARSARLADRPGIRYFERSATWTGLGARLNAAGIEWMNTGDSAANRLYPYADQIWPVFYVGDAEAAAVALGLVERIGTYGPSISLVPFDGVSEIGRWQDGDGMWFADRFQVLIDCYAGTTRMPEQADALIEMWTRSEATSA